MPPGLDNLKHLVVLMMENRSFDHMLGGLWKENHAIDGLRGDESNPDTTGTIVKVQPKAKYQSQLTPDPDHDFAPVDQQIFNGGDVPGMQGFIACYFNKEREVENSRNVIYYFRTDKLPVRTATLWDYARI